jgi:hypothetical protein
VFATGALGQYYDVQGTTWTTAPQFDSPDQTVSVGGRRYYLFYSGQHVQVVAWYAHGAVYWVHNSLNDVVGNGEMLAIAEQTSPIAVSAAAVGRARLSLKAAGIPLRASTATQLSPRELIGGVAGVLTLLALPLLAFLWIRRIRDLRGPRAHLVAGHQIGVRLPTFSGPLPPAPPLVPPGRARSTPAGVSGRPLAAAAAGVGGAYPGALGSRRRWEDGRRTYRRSRLRRPAFLLGALALVAAAAVAAVLLLGGSATSAPARHTPAARAAALPTVPVAVLNATSTPGAAHSLAVSLQASKVRVSEVGNVSETRPPGTEVLYAAGERQQAERVARLLAGRKPTVAPIDPVVAAAAGSGARVVVVVM